MWEYTFSAGTAREAWSSTHTSTDMASGRSWAGDELVVELKGVHSARKKFIDA